jgi:hypothetical protein
MGKAIQTIDRKIFLIQGHKVMLDTHLAELYGVEVRILVRNVKRNQERFPVDFMFQLSNADMKSLRSQFGISSAGHGGRRYLPYVFTEQGIAMLSSVLHSDRAIKMNVVIMRAFVRLRESLSLKKEFGIELEKLERKLEGHDVDIQEIFQTLRQLTNPPMRSKRKIGFV